MSHFLLSLVACHLSPLTCHLRLTLTATATISPPANSYTMCNRLFSKDQQIQPKWQNGKNHWNDPNKTGRGLPISATRSLTRSFQSIRNQGFQEETDGHKHRFSCVSTNYINKYLNIHCFNYALVYYLTELRHKTDWGYCLIS